MDETLEIEKRLNRQGNRFFVHRTGARFRREMNVQRKPHPYSIEVILGLKDSTTTTSNTAKRTQSFRPYYKPSEAESEELACGEMNAHARFIPRLGLVPRSPTLMEALNLNGDRDFVRCVGNGLQSPIHYRNERDASVRVARGDVSIIHSPMDRLESGIERTFEVDQGKMKPRLSYIEQTQYKYI